MHTPHRIDVHAHFPIDLHNQPGSDGPPWSRWDTSSAIQKLDILQVQRQYLSLPVLPSGRTRSSSAKGFARAANEKFASIIAEAPDRFGAFATIPGDDIGSALVEARRAIDVLGLHGIALSSNTNGRYLGDPWYEPLFALAEARAVPVFVHPALNPRAAALTLGRPAFLAEFPVDTFRSIVDAVYAGVMERYPQLRLIVAHCGGALPALAWRASSLAGLATPGGTDRPSMIHDGFRRLYLDTALSGSAEVIQAAIALVGDTHILYGTDSGAAPDHIIAANTDGLANSGLSRTQLAGIESGNAAALFR